MKNQKGVSIFTVIIILGIIAGLVLGLAYYVWWRYQYNVTEQYLESKEELQEIQKKQIEDKAKELQKEEEERQRYMEEEFDSEY